MTRNSGRPSAAGARRGSHVGELRREGQAGSPHPFRRVRAQRFAHGVADQRGAIGDVVGLAFELRVGEQHEPGAERGAVGLVGQPDLRRTRTAAEAQSDEGTATTAAN